MNGHTDGAEPSGFAEALLSRLVPGSGSRRGERRYTALGSPCAHAWDDAWVGKVEEVEGRLQRRVCGARTMGGNPCELAPNHANGRCRFHGGFALTGAPRGNRNAVVHGLYSRRLRPCDAKCPQWGACPCAGADVEGLKPVDRPTCPYEQTEYNTALSDALAQAAVDPDSGPMALHVAHTVATLHVLMGRAALMLRDAPLVDAMTASREGTERSGAYAMESTKPSAPLQAFMRIASEYRHFLAMLRPRAKARVSVADHIDGVCRALADTDLDPDREALLHPDASGLLNDTERHLRASIAHADAGDNAGAEAAFREACTLARATFRDGGIPLNGTPRPEPRQLSERSVDLLLKRLGKRGPRRVTRQAAGP